MRYISTSGQSPAVTLREAVLSGMPADGGLYFPESIPALSSEFLRSLPGRDLVAIALEVARTLIGDELKPRVLDRIVTEAIDFEAPLVEVSEGVYALELFHGPTLAFKDFGARFMARLMGHFVEGENRELTILVATSGDTGSAVAHGFFEVPGIKVVILYPSGKVSRVQEQQLTTLGGNIVALEVEGTFDDCQRLVKAAFVDSDLRRRISLSSANSINIARLIPQTFYYFGAVAQLPAGRAPVIAVPSGNFGNLTAGLMARAMGLNVAGMVAATNVNDVFPEFLRSGIYEPRAARPTISNAMDVGDPSNQRRICMLFENDVDSMRRVIVASSYSDKRTLSAIESVAELHGYVMDPHGAVGYLGLIDQLEKMAQGSPGVFLETAHPAKFAEALPESVRELVAMPERLAACLKKAKNSIAMAPDEHEFKEYLLSTT